MLCAVIVDSAIRMGVVGATVMSAPTRLSFAAKTSAAVDRRGRNGVTYCERLEFPIDTAALFLLNAIEITAPHGPSNRETDHGYECRS